MKKKLLTAYFHVLAWCARKYLAKHKPYIIGINGSVGKTSCRMIVTQTLQTLLPSEQRIYTSPKNFNGELGMSLSILQIEKRDTSLWDFIHALCKGLYWSIFAGKRYDIILLEYGIDRPGEMDFLLTIAKPNIGIMTKLDAVHSLQFGDPQAIAKEEVKMIKATKDIAYLNSNDNYAREVFDMIDIDRFFYRTTEDKYEVDYNAIDFDTTELQKHGTKIVTQFTAIVHSKEIAIKTNLLEKHNLGYIGLSLSIADLITFQLTGKSLFDQDLFTRSTIHNPLIFDYELQPGRFSIFEGLQDSIIIDSTYNAAPQSIRKAVDTIYRIKQSLFPDYKIIIVFGEMRELGDFEEKEHRLIAPVLSHVSDYLVMVGNAVDYTKNELIQLGIEEESISVHRNALHAADSVKTYMKSYPQDKFLILCKGSQNTIFLEETVKALLKNKEDEKKLCRQSESWMGEKEKFFRE